MKIAIITPQLSQGGAEKMVFHLALGLKSQGDEVAIFSSGGYYGEKLLKFGIKSTILPLASLKEWIKPLFWKTFAQLLKNGDYDIYHVQTIPLAFLVRFIARLNSLNAKTILTLHGSPEWKIRWILPILRWLKLKICAVSKRLAEQVQGEYIPNAVDISTGMQNTRDTQTTQITQTTREDNVVHSKVTITGMNKPIFLQVLIVARLVPEKGIDLWLKAVKQLRAEGIVIETWLAGEGQERENLRRFGSENDLKVHFLGWIEEPWKLSQEINLFVLPSRREGEPLALLEAMAFFFPILATKVGGIPELLKDGRGICVEPSPQGLVGGIKHFLQLSSLECTNMLEYSYEYVRSRTWETCVAAYKNQYRAVLDENEIASSYGHDEFEEEKTWDKD